MSERIEPPIGDVRHDSMSERTSREDSKNPRRKPWLAFLLGFLVGPISWAYVGHYSIGVLFYLAQLGLAFMRDRVHEGEEVKSGVKYVLRTDVMYQK